VKSLLSYVKKSFNIVKRLSKNIPSFLNDSEELVRRCQKRAIKNNGEVHKNAFYFGYHKISVDRSKYRSYKKTFQGIPKTDSIDNWRLIKGVVQHIKPVKGVEEIKADPLENNPAHALIICDSRKEKRNDIASDLSKIFTKVLDEKYRT